MSVLKTNLQSQVSGGKLAGMAMLARNPLSLAMMARDLVSLRDTHKKPMCQIRVPQKTVIISTNGAKSALDIAALVDELNAGGIKAVRL